ncbi:MAG: response regulator transcription factor [Bacteroidetes bacterium]|nr:response regulator transcription factor [Bacteroidota bacterium]
MITAIAIDDEIPALKVIENFCAKSSQIELKRTFNRPSEALAFLDESPVDLLFLDINMPSLSGLDLYRSLKKQTMVIFTTAYTEYAVEGFALNAIDYLLKPFTFERFEQAVNKACEYYDFQRNKKNAEPKEIYIRADYSLIKLPLIDILYIEGLDDYLKIHVQGRKPIVARMTMKNILTNLPSKDFIRVHRSFIVPIQKIEKLYRKSIFINQVEIPIGISYEKDFQLAFSSRT